MTEHPVDVTTVPPLGAEEFAEALRYRNQAFRERMVQIMLLGEMARPDPPRGLAARRDVRRVARRRRRHDHGGATHRQRVTRPCPDRLRTQRLLRADVRAEPPEHLHTTRALDEAWEAACAPTTSSTLGGPRSSTVPRGRSVRVCGASTARAGSRSPVARRAPRPTSRNTTGSTCSPTTARRWSRRSRCSVSSPGPTMTQSAFALLAMVLGLFETGYLYGAAEGFFSTTAATSPATFDRMAVRLADATYRARCWPRTSTRPGAGRRPPTSSPPTGSRTPTDRSKRCAPTTGCSRAGGRGSRRVRGPRGARWHLTVPVRARKRRAHAEEHEYDSYGAEPA